MMKTYLVCVHVESTDENPAGLEVIGVFSSKENAIKECKTEYHFWGEFEIDKAMHKKGEKWPTDDPYPIEATI